ncbi:MAG: hypothetical protein ACR2QV_09260 [Gammaproteobacteria bacterium]
MENMMHLSVLTKTSRRSAVAVAFATIMLCSNGGAEDGDAGIDELDANEAEAQTRERAEEAGEESLAADLFGETSNCVNVRRISRTDVLDDRSILFYMHGSEIYLNKLPFRCSGLRMADAFSYDVRTSQLCDIDVIRVVRTFGGDMRPGIGCPLGKFQQVTEEQVMFLRGIEPGDRDSGQDQDQDESEQDDD